MDKEFEIVIGLEVHVELKTRTKIFCGCRTDFGGEPNSQTCPVCMGLPGTLPVLNEQVVNFAIQAGLATNCQIRSVSRQDRKHYFYPDLPTSYQISQDKLPLCYSGYLDIDVGGQEKRIGISQIHIEEDAGKLIHRKDGTLVDYNRSGLPLIEIVTEPDLSSAEEVRAFLQKLRAIMLYTGISDGKMNEGSFRCDVNLSVRAKGDKELGRRTEVKNLNSFQSIMRAIDYEAQRQINEIRVGNKINQETRGFDQERGKTFSLRSKEDVEGYRYLPDPDLMPIFVDEYSLEKIRESLPQLPDSRKKSYMENYELNSYDAEQLVSSIEVANYFEEAVKKSSNPKILANLMISEIFRLTDMDNFIIPFPAEYMAELVNLLEEEKISISISKKIIDIMAKEGKSPIEIIREKDLEQIKDRSILNPMIDEVIEKSQKAVDEYRAGKEKALQSIIGQIMAKSKGKASPEIVLEILREKLK